jgi:hypothetical protein
MFMVFHSKQKIILSTLFLVALIMGAVLLLGRSQEEDIACTLEAKLCPDGSYVGRVGPQCEFAQCPEVPSESGWETFSDSERDFSFQYPARLSTTYIQAHDWPPQVELTDDSFTCTEAGSPEARAGRTQLRIINNRTYCVTEVIGAAAGSVYTQYAYTTQKGNRTVIFTFSIRMPQCANYGSEERQACERERENFNIDSIVDRMLQTFRFML